MRVPAHTHSLTASWRQALVGLLAFALTGCGLGTEIGNGAHPSEEDEEGSKASRNADEEDPDQLESATNTPATGTGSGTADPMADTAGALQHSLMATLGFDPRLLASDCGSPFARVYQKPVDLRVADATVQPAFTYDATAKKWLLGLDGMTPELMVAPTSSVGSGNTFPVSTTNMVGTAVGQDAACGTGKVQAGQALSGKTGSFTRIEIPVRLDGTDYQVVWHTSADGQALIAIAVTWTGSDGVVHSRALVAP